MKHWIKLWAQFFHALYSIIAYPLVCLYRYLMGSSKRLAVFFVAVYVITCVSFTVSHGISRQEMSVVLDSISAVNDSLKNGDRYAIGYADGIKAATDKEAKQLEYQFEED